MPSFLPYQQPTPLPAVGDGFERATLDLKQRADLAKTFHLAKDVAAFANHVGGALLIGAAEDHGRVGAYVPLSEAETNDTQDAISKEVSRRCSPQPFLDFARYPQPAGGFVLAVNVYPVLGPPIGVKVTADKTKGGYAGDDAFAFPVRSGSDSVYLLPEQLPMYMLPEWRKIEILLSNVKVDEVVKLHCVQENGGPGAPFDVKFKKLDAATGSVSIEKGSTNGPVLIDIPFDGVRGIWKAITWRIAVRGFIAGDAFHWRD